MKSEADNLKEHPGFGFITCVPESFIVLFNDNTFEVYNQPFKEVVNHIKSDNRFNNYSHNGATIIGYRKIFTINNESVEQLHLEIPEKK